MVKIAISGKMASGKSTVSKMLKEELGGEIVSIGSVIKPLANLLIDNQSAFKLAFQQLNLGKGIEAEKEVERILSYFNQKYEDANWVKSRDGGYLKNEPYRKLLQEFPSLVRKQLGEDVFVRSLLGMKGLHSTEAYINDDMRLRGEKDYLESVGFVTIRLDIDPKTQRERLKKNYGSVNEKSLNHITETDLDHESFHFRVSATYFSAEEIVQNIIDYLNSISIKQLIDT